MNFKLDFEVEMDPSRHPSHLLSLTLFILCLLVHYTRSVPVVVNKIAFNSYPGHYFINKVHRKALSPSTVNPSGNGRYIENIHLNYLLRRHVIQNRTDDEMSIQRLLDTRDSETHNRIKGILTLNSKRSNSTLRKEQLEHDVSLTMDHIRDILGANLRPGNQRTKLLTSLEDGILTVLQRGIPLLNDTRTERVQVQTDKRGKLFRLRREAPGDGGEDSASGPRRRRFSGYKMFLDKTDKTSMLCPYSIEKDVNENRFPKTINRIKCKFDNCLCSNKGSFRCTQLWTKYEVQFSGSTLTDEVDVEHSCVCATSQSVSAQDLEIPTNIVS